MKPSTKNTLLERHRCSELTGLKGIREGLNINPPSNRCTGCDAARKSRWSVFMEPNTYTTNASTSHVQNLKHAAHDFLQFYPTIYRFTPAPVPPIHWTILGCFDT